jgi:PIN domain nuclease of toxin-antitoxin system
VQQLQERRGIFILWISRWEMEIKHGEGHLRLFSGVRNYLPHAACEDRGHAPVQARVTIE